VKSYGGLFGRIVQPANLLAAMWRAARGKRYRGPVARFLADAKLELERLRWELTLGTYRPRPLTQFSILDPKPRVISCADFRDRVVHHAVCAHVAPAIERRLIDDNYACRIGKGSHRAVLRARQFARRYGYWLRLDIRHYYANINHEILLAKLGRLFRERALRELLEIVVRHPVPGGAPGRGLPIGSLTSQWFANLYLDETDHWIKETCRAPGYVRYMDDFAVWADSRSFLWAMAADLRDRLESELRIEMKEEATLLAPCSEGMPFLGYRVFPGIVREKHARIRRRRRLLRLREAQFDRAEITEGQLQACVRSMAGPRRYLGFGEPLAPATGVGGREPRINANAREWTGRADPAEGIGQTTENQEPKTDHLQPIQ